MQSMNILKVLGIELVIDVFFFKFEFKLFDLDFDFLEYFK